MYLTRHWIFSSPDMPWIAVAMVWLLFLSYSLFGIIPTVLYLSEKREWIQQLPWLLDILNLAAKFPIPILVLIAFSTRPSGFHPCFS